jgi:hypothetical protein
MLRLNQLESVSRRGFIGGGMALGLTALKGASKAAGTTEHLAKDDILDFVRTFNPMATSLFANANNLEDWATNKKGFFPDKRKMLVKRRILAQREARAGALVVVDVRRSIVAIRGADAAKPGPLLGAPLGVGDLVETSRTARGRS